MRTAPRFSMMEPESLFSASAIADANLQQRHDMDTPRKPLKTCPTCGEQAEARSPEDFMRYGKGWFDCPNGHGFYSRGFNEIPKR